MPNSQSTPEEQIALLNKEIEENLTTIGQTGDLIQQKKDMIQSYSSAIEEFKQQINDLEGKIVELTASNSIINDIIIEITPING